MSEKLCSCTNTYQRKSISFVSSRKELHFHDPNSVPYSSTSPFHSRTHQAAPTRHINFEMRHKQCLAFNVLARKIHSPPLISRNFRLLIRIDKKFQKRPLLKMQMHSMGTLSNPAVNSLPACCQRLHPTFTPQPQPKRPTQPYSPQVKGLTLKINWNPPERPEFDFGLS